MSEFEIQEREKLGDEVFERLYGKRKGIDLKADKQFPQGYGRQSLLQERLEQQAPFYLSRHPPIVARKTDENNYQSAMEQARSRFENRLEAAKSNNKKSLVEYH